MGSITISGIGAYVPEKKITNFDLEKTVDTSNEWILERTGIAERRQVADNESSSTMGAAAANEALISANLLAENIDLIITATCSPDGMFPSTANRIQSIIGAKKAVCFDVNSACNGFLTALAIANGLLDNKNYKKALIIGSETLTRLVDWQDRNTCILFGDGAGAVVIEHSDNKSDLLGVLFGSDGTQGDLLFATGPASIKNSLIEDAKIIMDGPNVFKNAVNFMTSIAKELLIKTGKSIDDISLCIPHQANERILNAVASNLSLDKNRVFNNIKNLGNTSAASIPIALHAAYYSNRLKKGDTLLFTAFGAGLNWGSALINWNEIKNPKE
ncbi:MAG: 3-oxoacyl-[acyl-carrier-protein] synthase-3 [Chloroflexi bacterium]|mgnify:CR=1 FL=1|jgi:3-oxoacyl-[acyl-carrier-protein] synthase-3|nr:MAG: 3-oxoacyl-[acyl-carrier-protein] synthase-3 [Chloroflexota bacterium]